MKCHNGYIFLFLLIVLSSIIILFAQDNMNSIYDFQVKTIDGEVFKMETLKGKKIMIVNTASKCGFTNQYKDLQLLYKEFGGSDFEILAFPSNDFMNQEPGTNDEIKTFCEKKYDISFKLFEKIHVKGKNKHPLYTWLTQKEYNGVKNYFIKWNFQKFLINKNGEIVDCLSPNVKPNIDKVLEWLKN